MRNVLVGSIAALVLSGCASSSSGDDASVKAGSGEIVSKPKTPENAARDTQMQQAGNSMNDARAQAAAAEAAAKAKTGGK